VALHVRALGPWNNGFLVHARHGARYFTGQAFLLIALFWVTMNVLLWRAEYSARDEAGSVVPVGVAWQRILTAPDRSSLALAVKWEARYDTLKIGQEPVRVYRVETRLLDRYPIKVFISRAGEILRVELPDGIVLMHDQLAIF
jgi:hypothetical protein